MAGNEIITNMVLDAAMHPPLSDREKALRDMFVEQYFVDYNATNAALRCGFMRSFATEYATQFMGEPYVQMCLAQHQNNAITQDPETDTYTKQRIMNALMKEAHYHGPGASHGARVSALAKLASLHGMDREAKATKEKGVRGGVMSVPAIADIDEWEEVAVTVQEKLVQHARD